MLKTEKMINNVSHLAIDWKDDFSSHDLSELMARHPNNTLIKKFGCYGGMKMMISCPYSMCSWLDKEENVDALCFFDCEDELVKSLYWNEKTIMVIFENENIIPLPIADSYFYD